MLPFLASLEASCYMRARATSLHGRFCVLGWVLRERWRIGSSAPQVRGRKWLRVSRATAIG